MVLNTAVFKIFVPLENFSLIWICHHYQWRATYYDLCWALIAIEQWGFFRVPHLLWHGASVYTGHLQGPLTLVPITERSQWSFHYLFLRLTSVAAGIRTLNLPLAGRTFKPTAPTPRQVLVKQCFVKLLSRMKNSISFRPYSYEYNFWIKKSRKGINWSICC